MVIATTATHRDICRTFGRSATDLYEELSLTDSNSTFEEDGEEFHVFACLPIMDGNQEIIEPLQKAGFKAKQL